MMECRLWVNLEHGHHTIDDIKELLKEHNLLQGELYLSSIVEIEEDIDFPVAMELLYEKGLVSQDDYCALLESIPADNQMVLEDSYGHFPNSFLTKEDRLVIAMEYANIPIRLSPPRYMMKMARASQVAKAQTLLQKSGIATDCPKVLPLLKKQPVVSEAPIRYLSKQDIAQMFSKGVSFDDPVMDSTIEETLQALKGIST